MALKMRLRDNIKRRMIGFWVSDGEEIAQELSRIAFVM
jgi:hypothetical protein